MGAISPLVVLFLTAHGSPLTAQSTYPQTRTLVDSPQGGIRIPAKPARPAPSKDQGGDDGGIRVLPSNVLPPLNVASLLAEDASRATSQTNKILRVGVARTVRLAASDGRFVTVARGKLWAAELQSSDAVALRVHFSNVRLPQGAQLAVVKNSGGVDQISWIEVGFGQNTWSDILAGDRLRIEYFVPTAGASGDDSLPFLIDSIHHFYRDPLIDPASPSSGSCHNDVSCNPALADLARSVARVVFVKGNESYLCSGQLLNSLSQDRTPYFLTARHCIDSQASASTAQFFWLDRAASCNGATPRFDEVPRSAYAKLLSTHSVTDHSLLLVEGGLPQELAWSGWTTEPVLSGTSGLSLHHPSGDAQKASYGASSAQATCGGPGHLRINWVDGPTEPGSSGAGLFRQDTQQLVGQLHCGQSACGNESSDDFGAFAGTYPLIATWLKGGIDDLLEPNDSCAAAITVTPATYTSQVVKSTDPDWYRIAVPPGKSLAVTLAFSHAFGDIDLELFSGCSGLALARSVTVGNTETVTVTNNTLVTQMYRWNPYLYTDTRNSFSMTVLVR